MESSLLDSKLFMMLNKLSSREFTRFKKFVSSPYFNTDEKLIKIVEILESGLKKNPESVTREKIHKKIFPKEAYDYFRISNLLSYISKLLEEFITYEYIKSDDRQMKFHFMAAAQSRGLPKLFPKVSTELERILKKRKYHNTAYFQDRYQLEYERDNFFITGGHRTFNDSLREKIHYLDLFYTSSMLRGMCEWINRKNVLNIEEDLSEYHDFVQTLLKNKERYESYPYIIAYLYIFLTLIESDNEQHFYNLKNEIIRLRDKFERIELSTLHQFAQNYCIKKVNSGNSKFRNELFELYKEYIDVGLIFRSPNRISEHEFKNISSLAAALNEFEWAKGFIKEYTQYLDESQQLNASTYASAILYYNIGDLDESIRLLNQVEFKDVYYHISAKLLLMKVYYELDEDDALDSLIHAFRTFLRRNKVVSTYQKNNYNNFIRFTKKAARLRNKAFTMKKPDAAKEVDSLITTISATKGITNVSWLVGQLRELNENFK